MASETNIDTTNRWLVSMMGNRIAILNPPKSALTKQDALTLAAWIVALACDDQAWEATRRAVEGT